jgi:hypothetical protein
MTRRLSFNRVLIFAQHLLQPSIKSYPEPLNSNEKLAGIYLKPTHAQGAPEDGQSRDRNM